jgi:F-type H+-transporting ATPase subunit epsilon
LWSFLFIAWCDCSYLQYLTIAARTLRAGLKEEVRVVAVRRDDQQLKISRWAEGKGSEYST